MNETPLINNDSVILVSGGGRGITALCVVKLSQKFPANYILLGRSSIVENMPFQVESGLSDSELKRRIMEKLSNSSEKPTPQIVNLLFKQFRARQEIETTLEAIRKTGSTVEYIDVDVSNAKTMREKLADPIKRLGKVTGVIHGAGSLADRLIEKKTEKDYETVIKPKIDGLINLLDIAPVKDLHFLVLFSSIVGVYGNIGQTDYAIANEVLNKAAHHAKRENPSCRVLSINWGPWDSGMVTPELKQAFAERNMGVIPANAGAELLVEELTANSSNDLEPIQIVVGATPSRPAGSFSSDLKTFSIRRNLLLELNPFLLDHKIGNKPVLPATCAATWVVSTCEQLNPGYTFFKLEDYKVLKGIVFDDTLAKEHILELKEIEKSPDGKIIYSARLFSENKNNKPIYHYSLKIVLTKSIPLPPKHHISISEKYDGTIEGSTLYQDGTLFHGPAFHGVQRVINITDQNLVMECNLANIVPETQGQFPVHTTNPFIYDAIVQSLLIWSQYYYQDPCLPSTLVALEQYKPIPFNKTCMVDMQIVSHSQTSVVADIYVVDSNNNVYLKFSQLQGTISPLLKRFIGAKSLDRSSVVYD